MEEGGLGCFTVHNLVLGDISETLAVRGRSMKGSSSGVLEGF